MNQQPSSGLLEDWIINLNKFGRMMPQGLRAFLVTIVFLILGFLTLWLASVILNLQQGAVLVAILLIPILAYLILSGKLLEFSAGGVTAKFNVLVQSLVFYEPLGEVGSIEFRKGDRRELDRFLNDRSRSIEDEDIVLTVKLHSDIKYNNKGLLDYLRGLSRYQNFSFLVILDQNGKVSAYITSWRAIEILQYELDTGDSSLCGNFTEAINAGPCNEKDLKERLEELVRYYGLMTTTALITETNLEVLKKMAANKMDALIVTNEKGKLKGVVKRGQLLNKLMLATAKQ